MSPGTASRSSKEGEPVKMPELSNISVIASNPQAAKAQKPAVKAEDGLDAMKQAEQNHAKRCAGMQYLRTYNSAQRHLL